MPCPSCTKPTIKDFAPFCSKRCADVDLGRWFLGGYALPSEEPLGEEEVERIVETLEEQA